MSGSLKRWLVRDATGRIRGPYTTIDILKKIGNGDIVGDEHLSPFPGNTWVPIAQDPEFYDRLLDLVAKASDQDDEDTQSSKSRGRAVSVSPEEFAGVGESTPVTKALEESDTDPGINAPSAIGDLNIEAEPSEGSSIIELTDVKNFIRGEAIKEAKLPIIGAVVALVIVGVFFLTGEKEVDRIHLLKPQKKQGRLSEDQVRSRTKKGVAYYVRDTYSSYLKAQNELVQVVEGDPRNAEVYALLCMTYFELWPFTFQDSKDLKTISAAAQAAMALDPVGPNGTACKTVDLIVRGRYIEAKGQVETILESFSDSEQPPIAFYYLKAYLLDHSGDYNTALGYVSSAQKLWPQWLKVYSFEADLLKKVNQVGSAAKRYRQVLKVNPGHIRSKINLGIIEYKHFNHLEKGRSYLLDAVDSSEKVKKSTLSRAYLGLAQIALYNSRQSRALKYAQQSYSLNSSNTVAKNIIIRLGGVEKLKKTKVRGQQLVYEGDQFVREGDCNAAQAHYKSAFEMNNKNGVAAMKAAKCLWDLSFSTEAIEWLNKAIKADPKLIEAYTTLADYYTQRYNYEAAVKILRAAKNSSPRNYEVYRGYALVELRRNNPKGAIAYGKNALKLYETDIETHIIMAKAYLKIKDPREAFSHAKKAEEIDVNNRRAQIVLGQSLSGIQGVETGIYHITKLVNRFPLITEYRMALGEILEQDERYDQAKKVYQQIIEVEKKPKKALIRLGRILRILGSVDQALESFLSAAVIDPADATPLFEAGLLYLDIKKPREALNQFKRVMKINKLFPLVHYNMGRAHLLLRDPKSALHQAELERRNNPQLADAYLLAADAHMHLRQYSLCASEYQKAIQLRSQGSDIYVKVGRCYRLSGNLDAAIQMLTNAATIESGNPEIYKELGAIYEIKGDIQRAVSAYDQYFVLYPNAPDVSRLRAHVRNLQFRGSY